MPAPHVAAVGTETIEAIHSTAIRAAREAGVILARNFRGRHTVEAESGHDITLAIDRQVETAAVSVIRKRFPGHRILAEEGGLCGGDGPFLWVIDPLDGTVNYAHGLPHFCTAVCCHCLGENDLAATRSLAGLGEPISAVVYAPVLCEIYTARRGEGTHRNDRPVQIHLGRDLGSVLVGATFGSTDAVRADVQAINARLGKGARKLRSFGATALDLAYVAAGHLGGLYHPGIRTWDLLAGRLLVEEAGGIVEATARGDQRWELTAGAPGVHVALRTLIREAAGEGVDVCREETR